MHLIVDIRCSMKAEKESELPLGWRFIFPTLNYKLDREYVTQIRYLYFGILYLALSPWESNFPV